MSIILNAGAKRLVGALGLVLTLAAGPAHAQRADVYGFQAAPSPYDPLTDATTAIGPGIDDSLSAPFDIGFRFSFAGRVYSKVQVSSNGFARLGATGSDAGFGNDLASTTLGPLLAPLWDDLKTGRDGGVRYTLSGEAPERVLTVEFARMHWDLHSDSANANFQVKLYETTGDVAFVYGAMGPVNNTSGGASIGLSNGRGAVVDFLSVTPGALPSASGILVNNDIGSAASLADGVTYRFTQQRFAHDLQAVSIDTLAVRMFDPFTPKATFRNLGLTAQTNVPVTFEVLQSDQVFYQNTQIIPAIAPGEAVQVAFDEAPRLRPGLYTVVARVALAGDENADNDWIDGTLLANWAILSIMTYARAEHTTTLLPDGRVLVAGGTQTNTPSEAEIYDPTTRTWTPTGSMLASREGHTATLLPDGKILVAGGQDRENRSTRRCELFDPVTQTWTETGPMANARHNHTATVLANGKVLVAGGYDADPSRLRIPLASSELYDPEAGAWKTGPPMATTHAEHTATALPDGAVLIAGGSPAPSNHSERYDPAANTWSPATSMLTGRRAHTAAALSDGSVLVAGGFEVTPDGVTVLSSAEIYNPAADTWMMTAPMHESRFYHAATVLADGAVMVVGGSNDAGPDGRTQTLSSAEMYDPEQALWSPAGRMARARRDHTATALDDGTVLVVGGQELGRPWDSGELYDHLAVLTTPTESHLSLPATFHLEQNYPNPFNPTTTIHYALTKPGVVTLRVYDLLGRRVRTLVDAFQAAGRHAATFDGSGLPSGVFFYQLQVGNIVQTRKMLLVK